MNVCEPHVCLVPKEIRRGCKIPWNLSYRWLLGNPGPLKERQPVLLTTEASLQPLNNFEKTHDFVLIGILH